MWFQCDAWPCQFTSLAFIFAATTTAIKITAAATNYVFFSSHIHSTRTQWERWRVWQKGQTRSSGLPVSSTVLFIVYNFVSSLPPFLVSFPLVRGLWFLLFYRFCSCTINQLLTQLFLILEFKLWSIGGFSLSDKKKLIIFCSLFIDASCKISRSQLPFRPPPHTITLLSHRRIVSITFPSPQLTDRFSFIGPWRFVLTFCFSSLSIVTALSNRALSCQWHIQ